MFLQILMFHAALVPNMYIIYVVAVGKTRIIIFAL
jgi:hypothetical protein